MEQRRNELRRRILARRGQMAAEERRAKSALITERLLAMPEFKRAGTIFTYINFRSEVETLNLADKCLELGKRLCVPVTLTAEKRLAACRLTDPAAELRPGYCRIPEPDISKAEFVAPREIDIVVLPGSVFDKSGGRLGYGGGYYDRFLAREAPDALRVGLAFELQIVDEVPLMAHDMRLHYLLSEFAARQCSIMAGCQPMSAHGSLMEP
ncbi:5-formyltetrahydrofolate cyclo-ligase [hydrothermal vent metagenome]|uniref:5-formyltetrahydrofolate cyclo-ligase n=1 Tax=hydrothermal vent metagenome TaxID=652676 RepID=A0A3B0V9Y5_9ZZZZ